MIATIGHGAEGYVRHWSMSMSQSLQRGELDEILSVAEAAADAAGKAILPHFRDGVEIRDKSGAGEEFDPVTAADVAAEEAIRQVIEAARPKDAIIGEEFPKKAGESGLTWVLDPIDGTRAFMMGLPLWGTLIALSDASGPIVGVIDQPYLGERFIGSPLGAWQGETRLATRACAGLSGARLSTTGISWFSEAERQAFKAVEAEAQLTRFGYDCYAYALVAHGFIDLVIEAGMQPYDIHALVPVVQAAGGVITDWRGGPAHTSSQIVAAGDKRLHAQALELIAPFAN